MSDIATRLRQNAYLPGNSMYVTATMKAAADEIERLRAREAILQGLAANDGNPDQEIARRALNLMDNVTELFNRADEQTAQEKS